MKTNYTVRMSDDQCSEEREIEADTLGEARRMAAEATEDWVRGGGWGIDGASIRARWVLLDESGEEAGNGRMTVDLAGTWTVTTTGHLMEIEPDTDSLIRAEGGCKENPGVWSQGGTVMTFDAHCRLCGLHRHEISVGGQRNPGDHDTVEYRMLDDSEIEMHRKNGDMDEIETESAE